MGVRALGRDTRGLFTRATAHASGIAPSTLDGWVVQGWLERPHAELFAVAGLPWPWERVLLAAVMAGGPGCVASHRSAARLWALGSWDAIDVAVARARLPRLHGAHVHRSLDLHADDCTVRDEVAVTNPLRTLIDLGAVLPAWAVRDAVDVAVSRGLVTIGGLETTLSRLSRRGRSGCGVLRSVLETRALGSARGTPLEAHMARLTRDHDVPTPKFQHTVRQPTGRFVARVDFAYPHLRIAIEVDGHDTHSTPAQLQSDLTRQNELVGAGWTVLRFTWRDVRQRQEYVATTIRRHLGTQRPVSGPVRAKNAG